jgi:RNA polymerase sigma factor (sigma-70 family)
MRDSEVVSAILAGDPAGLAEAYDRYAPALHAYCRVLLTEPADAADAVQDTFLIAASKLASLRDPDRLRPWLYAVARNECHRRLRDRGQTAGLDEAGEVSDESADVGARLEHGDLRELVGAVLAGLNPGEREIIELNLRHEVEGPDLADALGVPLKQAQALASRARRQFETSLGALLVAREGRESCAGLAAVLDGWDGRLTVLLRKRINRHIERCDVCGERRRRAVRPAMLLGMLPLAALPAGLRPELLRLVSSGTAADAAYHAHVLQRAAPFGKSGFPVQLHPPAPAVGRLGHALRAGAGFAALAVAGAALGTVLFHRGPLVPAPGHGAQPGTSTAPAARSPQPSGSPGSFPVLGAPGPTIGVAATGTPSAPGAPAPGGTPSPGTQAPGTLSASPLSVTLALSLPSGHASGSFTLTAHGGRVQYLITVPAQYVNELSVAPAAGLLEANQAVRVQVSLRPGIAAILTKLTIQPGPLSVTIVYVQL